MISIKNFNKKIHKAYRSQVGVEIAKLAREKGVPYFKVHNENNYPYEFLKEYFENNPVPVLNENCEPITRAMIAILPIKMLWKPKTDENLTTDGVNVFLGKKCVGFWKE